ncbi:DapH/DapD/GlmU-related protein [Fibrobacter sp.]|uniref:DapH/DapD/GlmU-related protein n=1 Tax=Fibrobacter sp. TaxID=35828 RepID=UPI00386E2CBC
MFSVEAILEYLRTSESMECKVLRASADGATLSGFAALSQATENDVSFWVGRIESVTHANGPSNDELLKVRAGLLFVPMDLAEQNAAETASEVFPHVKNLVAVAEPYHAMVKFLEHFVGNSFTENMSVGGEIHPTAVVEGFVDEGCFVGPGCVVMRGASVGRNCRLESNVTIYPNVVVGEGCIFQAGVVVGSRGFGFYEHEGERRMVPHFAGVRIGNRCSFGANTVVAAGFISPTTIGDNCHLDSMVQIAHNCVLGNNIYMASQTALGGTTILEDGVQFAGGAKAAGHLTVGKNAIVTAKAGVTKSVPAGKTVAGFPAIDIEIWRRQMVELRLMAKKNLK